MGSIEAALFFNKKRKLAQFVPQGHNTPTKIINAGVITNSGFILNSDALFSVILQLNDSPQGIIFELGGATVGALLGIDVDGYLTARFGDVGAAPLTNGVRVSGVPLPRNVPFHLAWAFNLSGTPAKELVIWVDGVIISRTAISGDLLFWADSGNGGFLSKSGSIVTETGISDFTDGVNYYQNIVALSALNYYVRGSAPPLFDAPLLVSTALSTGTGSPTFTRATTACVMAYAADAVSGDVQKLITVSSGEARFFGARRVSSGVYSTTLSDGTPIPSSELLGCMIEPAFTQLTLHNQDITDAYWEKASGLVSATDNSAVAPDGTTTACLLSELAGTGSHHLHEVTGPFTPVIATSYVMATFVKRPASSADRYVQLAFWAGGFGSNAFVNFDLQDLVAGGVGSSITGYGVQEYPNGWLMIWAKAPATATTLSGFQLAFVSSLAAVRAESYTVAGGSEESLYIWRPYVIAGYHPVLPLTTTTANVTKNADVLKYPNSGNVNDTHGTVLMEVTPAFDIPSGTIAGYGNNYLLDFGNNNGYMQCYNHTFIHSDGTTPAVTPAWSPVRNTKYKIASKWGSDGQKNIIDGVLGTGVSFDGSINSSTNMIIGGGSNASYNWGGYIKNIKIYNDALSDAVIQELMA